MITGVIVEIATQNVFIKFFSTVIPVEVCIVSTSQLWTGNYTQTSKISVQYSVKVLMVL